MRAVFLELLVNALKNFFVIIYHKPLPAVAACCLLTREITRHTFFLILNSKYT